MISETRWPLVWALIVAGVVGAFQIGKAAIAVPLLREDLGLSLTFASWVVGIYAAVGALAGLPMGVGVKYLGSRRAIVAGLLMIGVASCAGAFARGGTMLLVTRVFEGFGFIVVAIATPTLLRAVTISKDRDLVFALWTVYYSAGSVIVMLAGPWLAEWGWQSLWLVTGLLALGYAFVMWAIVPDIAEANGSGGGALADIGLVLRAPGPVLLALAFGVYTVSYHALTGLLPALLVERLGLSIAQAGAIAAASIVANGIGAFSAAWLLRAGLPLWAMVAAAFTFFGVASFGIFAQAAPVAAVSLLAAASFWNRRRRSGAGLHRGPALHAAAGAARAGGRHHRAGEPHRAFHRSGGAGDLGRALRMVERARPVRGVRVYRRRGGAGPAPGCAHVGTSHSAK